jgi:hypothetical protein
LQPTYECNVALTLKKTGVGNYDGVVVVSDSRTRGNLPPKSVDQFQELVGTRAVVFTNGKDMDNVSSMYWCTSPVTAVYSGPLKKSKTFEFFDRNDMTRKVSPRSVHRAQVHFS